jgi:hypothetical protein
VSWLYIRTSPGRAPRFLSASLARCTAVGLSVPCVGGRRTDERGLMVPHHAERSKDGGHGRDDPKSERVGEVVAKGRGGRGEM